MDKKGTLINVYGKTDGTSTSGDFSLECDLFENPVSYIRIDKGIVAKLWSIEISGAPVDVIVYYTLDVTATTITWTEVKRLSLSSSGELTEDKRRPIKIIEGRTGKEAIKFSWSQTTAAESYMAASIEFTEVED